MLEQLSTVRTLINNSLDVIDVSRWAGDYKDASFIAGQLRLLSDNIQEARQTLKGEVSIKPWWEDPVDEKVNHQPISLSTQLTLISQDL